VSDSFIVGGEVGLQEGRHVKWEFFGKLEQKKMTKSELVYQYKIDVS